MNFHHPNTFATIDQYVETYVCPAVTKIRRWHRPININPAQTPCHLFDGVCRSNLEPVWSGICSIGICAEGNRAGQRPQHLHDLRQIAFAKIAAGTTRPGFSRSPHIIERRKHNNLGTGRERFDRPHRRRPVHPRQTHLQQHQFRPRRPAQGVNRRFCRAELPGTFEPAIHPQYIGTQLSGLHIVIHQPERRAGSLTNAIQV